MATDEQRFAIGLGVVALVTTVIVLVLSFVDLGEDVEEAAAPTISAPIVTEPLPAPDRLTPDSVAVASSSGVASASVVATGSGVEAGDGESQSAAGDTVQKNSSDPDEPEPADVPVIDPVPLAYFDPDSNPLNLPPVIEKYIERVERGTRFMARLEAIVADSGPVDAAADSGEPPLTFALRSQSKRLSYNAVHTTQWLEANFAESAKPATADVLVDVRRGAQSNPPGERITLFFASVQDTDGAHSFALDLDGTQGEVRVFVYALDDALPALGSATLQLDSLQD